MQTVITSFSRSEIAMILKESIIRAFNLGGFSYSLPVILFVMFSVFTATGGQLTPNSTFTAISLLTTVRLTVFYMLVLSVIFTSEAVVAMKRIQVRIELHVLVIDVII